MLIVTYSRRLLRFLSEMQCQLLVFLRALCAIRSGVLLGASYVHRWSIELYANTLPEIPGFAISRNWKLWNHQMPVAKRGDSPQTKTAAEPNADIESSL